MFIPYQGVMIPLVQLLVGLNDLTGLDGAGMLRAYRSVVLPVSGPAVAVVVIWQFTSLWNDFLFTVFLTGPTSWASRWRRRSWRRSPRW